MQTIPRVFQGPVFSRSPYWSQLESYHPKEWLFPGSGKVIFLGTSLSLHILWNYFRAGSVRFMTNPFIYTEGWQFGVYPSKTLQGTGLQTKMLVQDSFWAIPRAVYLPALPAAAQISSYRCKLHLGFYLLSFLQPGHPLTIKPKQRQSRWFVSNTWRLWVLCCSFTWIWPLKRGPLDSPLLGNSGAKLEVLS